MTITINLLKLVNRSLHLFKLVANQGAIQPTQVNCLNRLRFDPFDPDSTLDMTSVVLSITFSAQELYLEGADPLDPSMDYVIDDNEYADGIDPASDAFSLDLEAYELSQAGFNVDPEYDFLEW